MTQDGSLDLCEDCGGGISGYGEGLALLTVFVGSVPLAALAVLCALSSFPSRWTRPWIARAVHAALLAQYGGLLSSLVAVAFAAGMLAEDFDVVATLLASPLLLHTALNVAGIVAWRRIGEALPAPPVRRIGILR